MMKECDAYFSFSALRGDVGRTARVKSWPSKAPRKSECHQLARAGFKKCSGTVDRWLAMPWNLLIKACIWGLGKPTSAQQVSNFRYPSFRTVRVQLCRVMRDDDDGDVDVQCMYLCLGLPHWREMVEDGQDRCMHVWELDDCVDF